MKIAYDITVLGIVHCVERAERTGVFRVVEEVGRRLLHVPDCDMRFVAPETTRRVRNCLEYLRDTPFMQSGRMDHSRAAVRWDGQLAALGGSLAHKDRVPAVLRRTGANVLQRGRRVIDRMIPPLSRRQLADCDLYHSPFDPFPDVLDKAPHLRRLLTVHDVIPLRRPEWCNAGQIATIRQILDRLRPNDMVLCNSEFTRDDLCDFLGRSIERCAVTHLAASPTEFYRCQDAQRIADVRRKLALPEGPYALGLSRIEPRKNIDHVIRCFAQLVTQQRLDDLTLVLVGNRGWKHEGILASLPGDEAVRRRIVFTGYVDEMDLAPLYSGAEMFLYLSRFEGFGLPPLEAMQCGVPVIASNTTSLPEVVGDAGMMLDPDDADGLCAAILSLHRDAGLRQSYGERALRRAAQFSWDRCAEQTAAAYRQAMLD